MELFRLGPFKKKQKKTIYAHKYIIQTRHIKK